MSLVRNAILGSWELESFASRDTATGETRYPMGSNPRGLILYTDDGFMSAQLAPEETADTEITDYIAYSGPFHVDENASTVRHEMRMATMPELLLQPQIRQVRLEPGLLILSAGTTEADRTTHSTLIWRRATPAKE